MLWVRISWRGSGALFGLTCLLDFKMAGRRDEQCSSGLGTSVLRSISLVHVLQLLGSRAPRLTECTVARAQQRSVCISHASKIFFLSALAEWLAQNCAPDPRAPNAFLIGMPQKSAEASGSVTPWSCSYQVPRTSPPLSPNPASQLSWSSIAFAE